jgi:hypothetical protein
MNATLIPLEVISYVEILNSCFEQRPHDYRVVLRGDSDIGINTEA